MKKSFIVYMIFCVLGLSVVAPAGVLANASLQAQSSAKIKKQKFISRHRSGVKNVSDAAMSVAALMVSWLTYELAFWCCFFGLVSPAHTCIVIPIVIRILLVGIGAALLCVGHKPMRWMKTPSRSE